MVNKYPLNSYENRALTNALKLMPEPETTGLMLVFFFFSESFVRVDDKTEGGKVGDGGGWCRR